jgi:hypothetical protein
MGNDKFRDLKIGDKVFVYFHENLNIGHKIKEVLVTNIQGSVTYPNLTQREIKIDTISVSFILLDGRTQKEKQTFSISFEEDNSRRGIVYTGFLTIEDALEFAEDLKEGKLKKLKSEIDELESNFDKLLTFFKK